MPESPPIPRLAAELRQVIISVNSQAGRRDARPKVDRLAALLRARGFAAEVLTDLSEVAARATESYARRELRAVVAAGGDGTVAEIVNRLPPGLPITTLPLGTENLLAKYLGIGRDAEAVCDVVAQGAVARLDAGRARADKVNRIFLLMASAGLDADVVRRLAEARRGHISHLSYVRPMLSALRNFQYPALRIQLRGQESVSADESADDAAAIAAETLVARWLFLFNLPCYARGIPFAPRARGDDGWLDLRTFQRGSFWHGLRYLWAVLRGRHERLAECASRRLTGLRVEAAEPGEPIPFQLDGDFGGFLPVDWELLRERLTLVVPPEWLARQRRTASS